MRVYILQDSDFEQLFSEIDRDPRWGERGGSSAVLSDVERQAHEDAHGRFNHRVRTWADKVRRGDGTR